MSNPLIDDCFRPGQEHLLHDEALAILRSRVAPVTGVESVPLSLAAGRILAVHASARSPVPAHTNAAVDGYAFKHGSQAGIESSDGSTNSWAVVGRAAAGHPYSEAVKPGDAVRIFTGAVVPEGTDTVIMQEDAEASSMDKACVVFRRGLKLGANVRLAGEDVKAGEALMAAGDLIRPQDLAGLASIGLGEVVCHKRLRVGIVSTGDEVIRPGGGALMPGQVYDANQPMLQALAASAGADVVDLGVWPDRADAVRSGLADAVGRFDVILTSGGASRGDEDHMAAALDALGQRHFWQILVKPGRPMMLGQVGGTVVVGLPGNPVAVFVCFLMYVWPMLRRLGGGAWPEPRRMLVPAAFAFPNRKVGRRELWRGRMLWTADGWQVDKFKRDGSGLISSLRWADCLIDIPEAVERVQPGDPVQVIPFSEYGIGRG